MITIGKEVRNKLVTSKMKKFSRSNNSEMNQNLTGEENLETTESEAVLCCAH